MTGQLHLGVLDALDLVDLQSDHAGESMTRTRFVC